ncbi:MAG: DUF2892 domain-containing protein [Cytophagaceae bacterium]|nr:DUF2892 domain-containing protein [Cytophagaceae bacterium]
MKKNMGFSDRLVRLLVAGTVVALFFTNILTGPLAYVLLGLAAVFTLTSFVSFCPLYAPFGFSTRSRKRPS